MAYVEFIKRTEEWGKKSQNWGLWIH